MERYRQTTEASNNTALRTFMFSHRVRTACQSAGGLALSQLKNLLFSGKSTAIVTIKATSSSKNPANDKPNALPSCLTRYTTTNDDINAIG